MSCSCFLSLWGTTWEVDREGVLDALASAIDSATLVVMRVSDVKPDRPNGSEDTLLGLCVGAGTPPKTATTPLRQCAVCGGSLALASRLVAARCYDLAGVADIQHQVKECCRRGCRTRHGHNFYWNGGKKINSLHFAQARSVLFVTDKTCFSLRFLRYHAALQFRCGLTASAVAWSYNEAFQGSGDAKVVYTSKLRSLLGAALTYYAALQEFEVIEEDTKLVIGEEISQRALSKYSEHVHSVDFVPRDPTHVKELVGDGHEKVSMKCSTPPQKRSGKPKQVRRGKHRGKKAPPKAMTNGWFMLVHPSTMRIVGVTPQIEPENNAVVTASLEKILPYYPSCDGFIYDRQCRYAPTASAIASLSQIEHWCVDAFHAFKHKKGCKYCAKNRRSIKRRFKGVNGSAAERVFRWFRQY